MNDPLWALIATGGLVFCRVAGLVAALPVFGAEGTPKSVPVVLAAAVTLLVAPGLPLVAAPQHLGFLVVGVMGEVLVGGLGGLTIRAVFAALAMATELMALQSGLASATLFNPLERQQSGPMGTFASWAASLGFLSTGLHLRCLEAVGTSFQRVPPGAASVSSEGLQALVEAVEASVSLGVQLSGPILAMVWFVNLLVAVLARLAPKMNVFFSVGMTLTSVIGVYILAVALPWILLVEQAALTRAVMALPAGWR